MRLAAPSQLLMSSVLAAASPPIGLDLVDDFLRRSRVGARTVTTATQVVDHHLGPVASEGQRVLTAESAPRTR